jgi:lipoprotein-releasing system permease protein
LKLPLRIVSKLIFAPTGAFSRFIMRISIAATTISVAAMIISLSFINGFQEVVAAKIFNFWGHIRVQHYEPVKVAIAEETPIKSTAAITNLIRSSNNIQSVTSFATRSAILNANGTIEGILLKGVDGDYPFSKLNQFLIAGKWPNVSANNNEIEVAISKFTANELGIGVGEKLLIYFILDNGEQPKTRKITISGIFNTGIDVYDKIYALGPLSLIQKMNSWGNDQIGGYEIDLKDEKTMNETGELLFNSLPPGLNAVTLKELSPEIFDWLNLQDTNKIILIVVMSIVAFINLITCLIILLLERTSMIAVLKALGARNRTIQDVFILYGSWISGIGILLGSFTGLGICFLQQKLKFIRLNEEAYYVSTAPVSIDLFQVFLVITGTFCISMLVLIIPSFIVKKISPVKTLQFR